MNPAFHYQPDKVYRFGAFADTGPDEGDAVYFATPEEAAAYARGYWAALRPEDRPGVDVYAGEVLFVEKNGRLGWSQVAVFYDAKEVAQREANEAIEEAHA